MSTTRSRPTPGPRHAPRTGPILSCLTLLGALALTACSEDAAAPAPAAGDPAYVAVPSPAAVPSATADPLAAAKAAPDVVQGLRRVLQQRASAISGGDQQAFRAGLAGDPSFRSQQSQYFENLRQLPLQVFALTSDPATIVRDGSSYRVNVRVTLQLDGYDAVPVTTVDRYLFTTRPQGGRLRLSSVTDAAWEARNQVQSQPWDAGPVVVRAGVGVLGVFDPGSVASADRLVASLEQGLTAVSAVVPYPWSRTVVVYALSDGAFLNSIPDLPGGEADDLDAVAFPVLADTVADAASGPSVVAGTRLALNPRMLGRAGPGRDRLLRHELTHAAVGVHDNHAPTWLGEGLAEYVSVQAEPPELRRVQPDALAAAEAGFTDLPRDRGFYDQDAAAHYGLSWWACEYVAATAGPAAVWSLLDQLEAAGVQSPQGVADRARQDAVLLAVGGANARTLARKAGKLLVTTFAPPPAVTPTPAPTDPVAPGAP
ncbi:MAG: hypothetical protein LH468_02890 [Nocardioides sp.]|nr:hypothetical protein [Nocardioides sp.]